MRIAPLAFVLAPSSEADRRKIREVCRITHHNDEAYAGALAVTTPLTNSQYLENHNDLIQRCRNLHKDGSCYLVLFGGSPS